MKHIDVASIIFAITFLSACSTQYEWQKPGLTPAQASQDALECQALAKRFAGGDDPDEHAYELCMQGKGYTMAQKKRTL
jgi:hypothetical protein